MRVASLDGLRGAAALAVVASHITLHLGLVPYPTGAVTGVLVFFVLSGYLIATICWRRPGTAASYRAFLARRAQRLFPAAAGLVALGLPLMISLGRQTPAAAVRDAASAAAQVTAFMWAAGVPVHAAWSPTWSLTVEWSFYIAFPAALWLLKNKGFGADAVARLLMAAAAILYVAALALTPVQFYLLPVANLAIMLTGAALALNHMGDSTLSRSGPAPGVPVLAGIALVLVAVLPVYTLSPSYRLVTMPAVCVSTLLVIHQCHVGGPLARTVSWRPLGAVGRRAYSLYLWHLPILWIVWVQLPGVHPPLQAAVAVMLTAGVVALSHHLLERPWMGHQPATTEHRGSNGTNPTRTDDPPVAEQPNGPPRRRPALLTRLRSTACRPSPRAPWRPRLCWPGWDPRCWRRPFSGFDGPSPPHGTSST